MENVKVSVNVPIYNAEKYLRKCLDSLSVQTLREVEFILVDDGSTDSCLSICNEYAAKDPRFKVFHKENGGSASARKLALEKSKGEYVIVCDADDWAEPTLYETLYLMAKNDDADLSICDYFYNYSDGEQVERNHSITVTTQEDLIRDVLTQRIPSASFVKLMRRDFIVTNNIQYVEGVNVGEDWLFLLKVVLSNPRIAVSTQPLYHYRKIYNGTSYTNSPNYNGFVQSEHIYNWVKENLAIERYGKEIFLVAIKVAFLGIRASNMDVSHHKKFLQTELPISLFIKYRLFNLKSLMVILAKMFRPISVLLYSKLNKYYYR